MTLSILIELLRVTTWHHVHQIGLRSLRSAMGRRHTSVSGHRLLQLKVRCAYASHPKGTVLNDSALNLGVVISHILLD